MRTDQESCKEYERIIRLSDYTNKKLAANSVIQTTHFMKKCVILNKDDSCNTPNNPFKRGIMNFEDFNY